MLGLDTGVGCCIYQRDRLPGTVHEIQATVTEMDGTNPTPSYAVMC